MTNKNPGWKQNYWEMMGVPIRIEIGEKEIAKNKFRVVRRDTKEKLDISTSDELKDIFKNINRKLFTDAENKLNESIKRVHSWENFKETIGESLLCLSPFCNKSECEENIKKETSSKSLCIPNEKEKYSYSVVEMNCVYCKEKATVCCLFGKSY